MLLKFKVVPEIIIIIVTRKWCRVALRTDLRRGWLGKDFECDFKCTLRQILFDIGFVWIVLFVEVELN